MARDVEADIIARDKTSPGTTSAERNIAKVKDQADKTGNAVERMLGRVDRQLQAARNRAEAWGNAGDSAGWRFAGRLLGQVAGVTSKMVALGGKLSGAIGSGISASGPYVTGALVAVLAAAAAAAAPVLAAAITAGILLGLGGVVIAAGIKAAADSPAVVAAFDRFKARASNAFKDFGGPFQGPIVRALDTFAAALERMAPSINNLGAQLAPVIDKLAPALASMAEKALPGIVAAAAASAPIFDALARSLPGLGASIGKFFETISKRAPEAAQFIEDMIDILGWLIEVTGSWIAQLAANYATARAIWMGLADVLASFVTSALSYLGNFITGAAKAFGWIPGLGPKLDAAAREFNEFAGKVNAALAGIRDRTVTVTARVATVGSVNGVSVGEGNTRPGRGGGAYASTAGWAPAAAVARHQFADVGGARTGGPVEVKSDVGVVVQLDGRPFYDQTVEVVAAAARRDAWRARVGRR